MDWTTLVATYRDPVAVIMFVVALAVSVKFLFARTKKVEETIAILRDNHLQHIGDEIKEQSRSLGRIEGALGALPCVRGKGCVEEEKEAAEDFWKGALG